MRDREVRVWYLNPFGEAKHTEAYEVNAAHEKDGLFLTTHEAKSLFIPWSRVLLIEEA